MAEEQNVVKRIVWSEVFSFPHIFKSFKMAIHPSKLLLGVLFVVLLMVGGNVLDVIWQAGGGAVPERAIVEHVPSSPARYDQQMEQWRDEDARLQQAAKLLAAARTNRHNLSAYMQLAVGRSPQLREVFADRLKTYNDKNESGQTGDRKSPAEIFKTAKDNNDDAGDLISEAQDVFDEELEKIDELLDDIDEAAEKKISNAEMADDEKDRAYENLERALEDTRYAITQRRIQFNKAIRDIEGYGIFESFIDYQMDCFSNGVMAVRYLNFTGGMARYCGMVQGRDMAPATLDPNTGLPAPEAAAMTDDTPGLIYYVLMSLEGVRWLIIEHWVFAVIFLLWFLVLWALLGGAMYRIAALHFAREEKISIMQSLRFGRQKFFSFFTAPLVPMLVIVVAGLFVSGVAWVLSVIPIVGPILLAVLFGGAILVGVGIAFMLIGFAAGWPLMYPTIAVEGSDSFDAISRSFSYVMTRPFRAILYGAVASVYGMITYLFVRLFAFLALSATHRFVQLGFWEELFTHGDAMGSQADYLDVLWHRPTFWDLGTFNWHFAGDGFDTIVGAILSIWVVLVVAAVMAYALTYFASASTCIYYILRRRVDATDLDDVYVEEEEEELPSESAAAPSETQGGEQEDDSGNSSETGGEESTPETGGENAEGESGSGDEDKQD
jgi:hypothetical protein